jgi:hypothetical protein
VEDDFDDYDDYDDDDDDEEEEDDESDAASDLSADESTARIVRTRKILPARFVFADPPTSDELDCVEVMEVETVLCADQEEAETSSLKQEEPGFTCHVCFAELGSQGSI